jgi:two-component system cell cycle response regulator
MRRAALAAAASRLSRFGVRAEIAPAAQMLHHGRADPTAAFDRARLVHQGKSVAHSTTTDRERLEVLVVDDDPVSRNALSCAVVALGHPCRSVGSGIDALAAHREQRADVIISDWTMPGIDGMELCRRVRALDVGAYTYLLFVSGHARKRDFVEAVRAGADDYLPKPVDLDDLEARLIAAGRIVWAYRQLAEHNVVLRRDSQASFLAARRDALTQVANRLQLDEDVEALQGRSSGTEHAVTIAMCDLDTFKRYNDHYGHPAGDEALRRVAQAIQGALRRADRVYRYGGEEFLIVSRDLPAATAVAAMERVRSAVEALAIEHAPGAAHPLLTVSIGMASVDTAGEHAVQEAIERADEALYRVKARMGNGVLRVPARG